MYFKTKKIRSRKLTRAAKGSTCTAHTPDCNSDPSKVVFAHAPCEDKGTATKSPDWWGADICNGCHYYLDVKATAKEAESYWMKAIYRTLKRRFAESIISIN